MPQSRTVSVRYEDVVQRSAGLRLPSRRTGTLPISKKLWSRITTAKHWCKGPVHNGLCGPPDSDWYDRCAVIGRCTLLIAVSICQDVRCRRNQTQSFTLLPTRHWLVNFGFLLNLQRVERASFNMNMLTFSLET